MHGIPAVLPIFKKHLRNEVLFLIPSRLPASGVIFRSTASFLFPLSEPISVFHFFIRCDQNHAALAVGAEHQDL